MRRYLNSWNRESGADHLGEPVRARRWLRGEGWAFRPDHAQLAELRRFRDELHGVVAALGARRPADVADGDGVGHLGRRR